MPVYYRSTLLNDKRIHDLRCCVEKHGMLKHSRRFADDSEKAVRYLEVSDAVTQCKSHVGQLRRMLWIGYRYT